MNITERSSSECDAVRDSERSNGCDQRAPAAHEKDKCEDKQQMINAEQYVLNAEDQIRSYNIQRARILRYQDSRGIRNKAVCEDATIKKIYLQQNIGLSRSEPVNDKLTATQPCFALQFSVHQSGIVDNEATYVVNDNAARWNLRFQNIRQAARN